MKRNQLLAFANAFPLNDADHANVSYEDTPWTDFPPQELLDLERVILRDFECDAFDLFQPIRAPRLIADQLQEAETTLEASGLLADMGCPICTGICKDVVVVKDCWHRFCAECIQKWLRGGHQECPQCRMKIPSRRALRHDHIFDAVISRLIPDVEKFEKEKNEIIAQSTARMIQSTGTPPPNEFDRRKGTTGANKVIYAEKQHGKQRSKRAASLRAQAFIRSEVQDRSAMGSPEPVASESGLDSADSSSEEQEDFESASSAESSGSAERVMPPKRRRASFPGMMMLGSPFAANLDYVDNGICEIFLVCLNADLPAPLLSMARELSKRPLKFKSTDTSRDVALLLARKLISDVIGPMDPLQILPEISFVKNISQGAVYTAECNVPLPDLSRSITESKGPTAVRYSLSPRLLMMCNHRQSAF